MGIQPVSIGQVNVQPTIMIEIKKGESAALRLDDGAFVVDTAPHIGDD